MKRLATRREARKRAERVWALIKSIAAEGDQEAFTYYESLGFLATPAQCVRLVRQCKDFVENHYRAHWEDRGLLFVVALDQYGPGVEVVV